MRDILFAAAGGIILMFLCAYLTWIRVTVRKIRATRLNAKIQHGIVILISFAIWTEISVAMALAGIDFNVLTAPQTLLVLVMSVLILYYPSLCLEERIANIIRSYQKP